MILIRGLIKKFKFLFTPILYIFIIYSYKNVHLPSNVDVMGLI